MDEKTYYTDLELLFAFAAIEKFVYRIKIDSTVIKILCQIVAEKVLIVFQHLLIDTPKSSVAKSNSNTVTNKT